MVYSRSIYNGDGSKKFGKIPSKKQRKLQGKTAYDKDNNNFGKSIWKKRVLKPNKYRDKVVIYVRAKCDKPGCNGHLEYDERNYKVCNVCGLTVNYDNNIVLNTYNLKSIYQESYGIGSYKVIKNGKRVNYFRRDESIKLRNHLWDELNPDDFIYFDDIGANKIKEKYERIKNFEKQRGR
jgi:hypothetical protein